MWSQVLVETHASLEQRGPTRSNGQPADRDGAAPHIRVRLLGQPRHVSPRPDRHPARNAPIDAAHQLAGDVPVGPAGETSYSFAGELFC
jgi:hypothetical protein